MLSRRVECGGGGNLSNKKGGMNRTGPSASKNDSEKRIYPKNLHEVTSGDELLSLIAWVEFVKNSYEEIRRSHQRSRYNHHERVNWDPSYKDKKKNFNPNPFNAFTSREKLREHFLNMLQMDFRDIPYESKDLEHLINYIINDKESGFGPYEDKEYFVKIWKYALEMHKTHGSYNNNDWEPDMNNTNTNNWNLWFGQSGMDFIHEKPYSLDRYNEEYGIKGPQNSPRM